MCTPSKYWVPHWYYGVLIIISKHTCGRGMYLGKYNFYWSLMASNYKCLWGGGGRHCLDINMRKYLHGHVLNGPHERRVEQSQDMYARRSLQSVGTPWPSHVAAKLATLQLNWVNILQVPRCVLHDINHVGLVLFPDSLAYCWNVLFMHACSRILY